MKRRGLRGAAIAILATVGVLVCVAIAALAVLQVRTDSLHDDFTAVLNNARYHASVQVSGVEPIVQDVSCGYAVIEMFSSWEGGNVTEESLYDEYGGVVTSTGSSFCDEMNKRFPRYRTTMRAYLTDSELLTAVHDSLEAGVPVPFEWAARHDGEWTLHYSIVTGMDLAGGRVTVANPYGYTEVLPPDELLSRTSFEAYADMPLYLRLGFAFGVFEENAVFIPERIS